MTTIPEPNTTVEAPVDPPAEAPVEAPVEFKPLTPTKRLDLLEARVAELEDRQTQLEEKPAPAPEAPFDPTLFVRRDEIDDMALRGPHLDPVGKCELCSSCVFEPGHHSGDPDLCGGCGHHKGAHTRPVI